MNYKRPALMCLLLSLLLNAPATLAADSDGQHIATLRSSQAIGEPTFPPALGRVEDTASKRGRAYPMQPPTIPHKVDGYRIDLNSNKCLSCHSRRRIPDSQAPMVSVTHFMDRDGNFLAGVSPRRYFCNQCHVVQTTAAPLVGNVFKDIDQVLKE